MKKIKLYFVFFFLTIAASFVSITLLTIKKKKENNTVGDFSVLDWSDIPESLRVFSEENSFKLEMQIDKPDEDGYFFVSSGTAWSWHYNKKSETNYEWYLMTNFHVVNSSIDYLVNESSSNYDQSYSKLLDYYSKNYLTRIPIDNFYFSLSKYNGIKENENDFGYSSIFNTFEQKENVSINSIDIITDFDNDNIELFSKGNEYNLDMSIIKIDLTIKNIYFNAKYVSDPYSLYRNSSSLMIEQNKPIVSNEKQTYIFGHPAGHHEMVGVILDEQNIEHKIEYLINSEETIFQKLKAPYYILNHWYQEFPLTGGASGSPIYQFNDLNESLWEILPVGIYWGGFAFEDDSYNFKPSFIPFIEENLYDVFLNFRNSLKFLK